MGHTGVPGRLQGDVAAWLLLLFEGVHHHLEAGVCLHGDQAGTEHTRHLCGAHDGALGAHFLEATGGVLEVLLTQ